MNRQNRAAPSTISSTTTIFQQILDLLNLVSPYKARFIVGLLALVAASALNLCLPALVKHILEPSILSGVMERPLPWVFILVGAFCIQSFVFFIRAVMLTGVGQDVVSDLRGQIFKNIINREISFFDKQKAAELSSRIMTDTALVEDAVSTKLSIVLRYGLQAIFGSALMAVTSFKLSIAAVAVITAVIVVSIVFIIQLRKASRALQEKIAMLSAYSQETLGAVRGIRALNAEKPVYESLIKSVNLVRAFARKRMKISATFQSSANLVLYTGLTLSFFFGIYLVHVNQIPISDFVAFTLYAVIVAVSFSFFLSGISELAQCLAGMERILSLTKFEDTNSTGKLNSIARENLLLECQNLAFSYNQDQPVLQDISLKVGASETVGIVGPSGSGKSTLIYLLLGFYQPNEGNVLLSKNKVTELSQDLRSKILGWCGSDPFILSGTVRDNLLLANPNATESLLNAACEVADFTSVIEQNPAGLDMSVGDRGQSLSLGQRQRLAIARLILQAPSIVILDEATSGLDSESEDKVFSGIKKSLPEAGILVISHRLATVRRASTVYVLEGGVITDSGAPLELSSRAGLYREYAKRQGLV